MKKIIILVGLICIIGVTSNAQVAVNTNESQPDASAMLDIQSTEQGFLPPRMTTAQRNAISSAAEGLIVYNTDEDCLNIFQGSTWYNLCTHSISPGAPTDCPAPELASDETQLVEVVNSTTLETWMDRNLGARIAARQSDDCWAYGNLYQWGRASDGHEYRTSSITSTNATTAVPNGGNPWDGMFITEPNSPYDWLTPQDATLWNGPGYTNNPCPSGYRLPTESELSAERLSWGSNDADGAFGSVLKLTTAGNRDYISGVVGSLNNGRYWRSTITGINARSLYFDSSSAGLGSNHRALGFSVRCIKD